MSLARKSAVLQRDPSRRGQKCIFWPWINYLSNVITSHHQVEFVVFRRVFRSHNERPRTAYTWKLLQNSFFPYSTAFFFGSPGIYGPVRTAPVKSKTIILRTQCVRRSESSISSSPVGKSMVKNRRNMALLRVSVKEEKTLVPEKHFKESRSCIGDVSNKSSVFLFYLTEIFLPTFFFFCIIQSINGRETWSDGAF